MENNKRFQPLEPRPRPKIPEPPILKEKRFEDFEQELNADIESLISLDEKIELETNREKLVELTRKRETGFEKTKEKFSFEPDINRKILDFIRQKTMNEWDELMKKIEEKGKPSLVEAKRVNKYLKRVEILDKLKNKLFIIPE